MDHTKMENCEARCANIRRTIISIADDLDGSPAHWGGSLSCVEILAVLYGEILNCNKHPDQFAKKDKLLLSKGHASMALYSTLAEFGLMNRELLHTYQKNGTFLAELAMANPQLGIECSGGSLGINLSMGAGMALLAKRKNYPYRTYVIIGDGELDEGSNWETIMWAPHMKLDNLTLVVDANGLQSDGATEEIVSHGDLCMRLAAFNWEVHQVDGHNCNALYNTFIQPKITGQPRAVIANTIKGKGISFMEGNFIWHDTPLIKNALQEAKREVDL